MTGNYGHFGSPAMRATVAVAIAAFAHLVLPFGIVEYRGPAAPTRLLIRFFEAADMYGKAPGSLSSVGPSIGLLFVGLAIAALGVTILMVLGYQPMRVDTARWMGATGGFLTVIGSAMVVTPAMYHVGTGFATFIGTLMATEFRAQFWAISPVIVATASLFAIHYGLQVMTRVAASHDQIRHTANSHANITRWAAITMALTLLVPWAMAMLPDGVSDSLNYDVGDDPAPLFFSAQDIQGATLAELAPAGHLRYASQSDWFWSGMAIDLIVAACWLALVGGALGAFVGAARSVGWPYAVERGVRFLFIPGALLWIAAAIFYLLSWVLFTPRDGLDATFLPGFWPILVPFAGVGVVRRQLRHGKTDEPAPTFAVVTD